MTDYRIGIYINGKDQASPAFQSAAKTMDGTSKSADGLLASLRRIGEFALGGAVLGGFNALRDTITSLGSEALTAYASNERLGMSLQSLMAKEIKNASVKTTMVQVGSTVTKLTEKENDAYDNLSASYARNTAYLPVQEQALQKRISTGKMTAEQINYERLKIDQLRGTIAKQGAELESYSGKAGGIVPLFKKITTGGMTMAQAMAQAAPEAKELLSWVQKLAIQSPLKQEGVATAFRTAMAYGFTSKEAKRLTTDIVDFTSAIGGNEEIIGQVAYALGQIRSSDKLLTQDLRQLLNAGVDVNGMLASMGYKLSDVGTTAISSKDFMDVFYKTMESDFAGAAQAQAATFSGLLSSLEDIKSVGLRELFAGTFKAAQPVVAQVVDLISSDRFMSGLRAFGENIGKGVSQVLGPFSKFLGYFQDYYAMQSTLTERMKASQAGSGVAAGSVALQAQAQASAGGNLIRNALAAGFGEGIAGLYDKAQTALAGGLPGIASLIGDLWTQYVQPTASGLMAKLQGWIFGAGEETAGGKRQAQPAAETFMQNAITSMQTWLDANKDKIGTITQSIVNGIASTTLDLAAMVAKLLASLASAITQPQNLATLAEVGGTMGNAIIKGTMDAFTKQSVGEIIKSWLTLSGMSGLANIGDIKYQQGAPQSNLVGPGAPPMPADVMPLMAGQMQDAGQASGGGGKGLYSLKRNKGVAEFATSLIDEITSKVEELWIAVPTKLVDLVLSIPKSIGGQIGGLAALGTSIVDNIMAGVQGSWAGFVEWLRQRVANIVNNLLPWGGGGGGGSVQNVTTNNFNMNVNSAAPVSTVVQDFNIMQSLASAYS